MRISFSRSLQITCLVAVCSFGQDASAQFVRQWAGITGNHQWNRLGSGGWTGSVPDTPDEIGRVTNGGTHLHIYSSTPNYTVNGVQLLSGGSSLNVWSGRTLNLTGETSQISSGATLNVGIAPTFTSSITAGTIAGNSAPTALTNNGLIQGTGTISAGFTNIGAGQIIANRSGRVLTITGAGIRNNVNGGDLIATSGGILRISSTAINNFNGFITANASQVEYSGATINDGFLTGSGTHVVRSNSTFDNVDVQSRLSVDAGVTMLAHDGAIRTADGQLDLSGSSANYSGSLVVGPAAGIAAASGSSLVVGDTLTIQGGSSVVVDSSSTLSAGHVVVQGQLSWAGGTFDVGAGQTFSGSGDFSGVDLVTIANGGVIAPGNSTGTLTGGAVNWGPGGIFDFEINDFNGTAGSNSLGWDLLLADSINITSTIGNPFIINLLSLTSGQVAGLADNFDDMSPFSLMFASTTGGITGFDSSLFSIDTSGFQNVFTGDWSVGQSGNDLFINYSVASAAVPEPSSFAILGLGAIGFAIVRRRKTRDCPAVEAGKS